MHWIAIVTHSWLVKLINIINQNTSVQVIMERDARELSWHRKLRYDLKCTRRWLCLTCRAGYVYVVTPVLPVNKPLSSVAHSQLWPDQWRRFTPRQTSCTTWYESAAATISRLMPSIFRRSSWHCRIEPHHDARRPSRRIELTQSWVCSRYNSLYDCWPRRVLACSVSTVKGQHVDAPAWFYCIHDIAYTDLQQLFWFPELL